MKDPKTGRRLRGGPNKRSLEKGVIWRADRNCWCARINVTIDGVEKNIFLGHYDEEADARKVRAEAVEKLRSLGPDAFRSEHARGE